MPLKIAAMLLLSLFFSVFGAAAVDSEAAAPAGATEAPANVASSFTIMERDFHQDISDGAYYWSKKANYYGLFDDEFIKTFEANLNSGDNFNLTNPVLCLKLLFRNLREWNPDQDLPWQTMKDNWLSSDLVAKGSIDMVRQTMTKFGLAVGKLELDWLKGAYFSKVASHEDNAMIANSFYQEQLAAIMKAEVSYKESEKIEAETRKEFADLTGEPLPDDEVQRSKRLEEIRILQTKLDQLNEDRHKARAQWDEEKRAVQRMQQAILQNKALTMSGRIIADIIEERIAFLTANERVISSLLANYYRFTPTGMTRYRDDLTKEWADLMPSDFYFAALDDSSYPEFTGEFANLAREFTIMGRIPKFQGLADLIDQYHKIPKIDRALAKTRIAKLAEIRAQADHLFQEFASKGINRPILEQIARRAALKANYIEKLLPLREETWRRLTHSPKQTGNTVVNTTVDALMDLDPAKRKNIMDLFERWDAQDINQPAGQVPDFFFWLEEQDTHDLELDARHQFLSLDQKRVTFFDSGLAHNDFLRGPGLVIQDGSYVYNIGEDAELYVLPAFKTAEAFAQKMPEIEALKLTLNHDTVMGGVNVLCAGIVYFTNGKITKIDTNSGHYKPQMLRHLRPAILKLIAKHGRGIFAPNVVIGDYEGQISLSLDDFLKATPADVGEKTSSISPVEIDRLNAYLKKHLSVPERMKGWGRMAKQRSAHASAASASSPAARFEP